MPDLWFPTNLLALTETSARAICDAGVRTVAASIDGTTKETYEKIRVPARWERLLSRLELLREVRRTSGRKLPRLRIIEKPKALVARVRRRLWHLRAGLDRWELRRCAVLQRLHGRAYPDRYYVIRPNGSVAPCIYWEGAPIGFYPAQGLASISRGAPLARIREGPGSGDPVDTCATCGERRAALYRLRRAPAPPPAPERLPTHPS